MDWICACNTLAVSLGKPIPDSIFREPLHGMQDIWLLCSCKSKALPPQAPNAVSLTGRCLVDLGQWAARCRGRVERGHSTISKKGGITRVLRELLLRTVRQWLAGHTVGPEGPLELPGIYENPEEKVALNTSTALINAVKCWAASRRTEPKREGMIYQTSSQTEQAVSRLEQSRCHWWILINS